MHRTAIVFFSLLTLFYTFGWAITPHGPRSRNTAVSVNHKPPDISAVARSLSDFASGGASGYPAVMKRGAHNTCRVDRLTGTPVFIDRSALSSLMVPVGKIASGTLPVEVAYRLIESNAGTFKISNPRDELVLASEREDVDGRIHLQFDQVYRGVPLWGQQLVVHLDADGTPYAVNGRYRPTPRGIDVDVDAIDADNALDAAREYLVEHVDDVDWGMAGRIPGYDGPQTDRCIYFLPGATEPRLVWHVHIMSTIRDRWHCFVDAESGSVIDAYNASPREGATTAQAVDYFGETRTVSVYEQNGVYLMYDEIANSEVYDASNWVYGDENSQDPYIITSSDNTWDDAIAVTVSASLRTIYEFYRDKYGRDSVDGKHMPVPCLVHLMDEGKPMGNAFWAGSFMGLGDPFAMSLDVIAHEWTHGVVANTAGLEYRFESGAIDEAYADLMGCMIDDEDWLMAEDSGLGPIRDISDPSRFNQPTHMSGYLDLTIDQDQGGVHYNQSIPALAGYFIAEELGREKAGRIFYHVLVSRYLTPQAKFIDLRLGAVQAAADLFGEDSVEVAAVKSAFDQVGIVYDMEPTIPPEDRPLVKGDEFIAFVYDPIYDGRLIVAKTEVETADDIVYLSGNYVSTGTSQPISVSGDGSYLVYVDWLNNIQFLDLETFEETPIDESGIWSSVALSPNGRYLAATLTDPDSTIYLLDLEVPDNSAAVRLYTQSDAGPIYTALYADALDWDHTSTHILYDAFNRVPVAGSDPVEFWDINILEVERHVISRVNLPIQSSSSVHVGNPSYAETNDRYIVCDIFPENGDYTAIATIDLFTSEATYLLTTEFLTVDGQAYPNLGYPRFSPDDSMILYEYYDVNAEDMLLYKQAVSAMRNEIVGDAEIYVSSASSGVWFSRGDNSVDVEEDGALPLAVELSQNFPNPFNPTTVIPFTVHQAGYVTLSVYDILGQEVTRLVDTPMMPGSYRVTFDAGSLGTGTYISRLKAGGKVATSKMQLVK